MFKCWKKTIACLFCCCFRNPINEIDEDTKLLPKSGTSLKQENRKIYIYGTFHLGETIRIIDLNKLATFSTYQVKKIVFGHNHCVIQFKNKTNELGLLGSNENGQLGLELKQLDLLDPKGSSNILYTSELKTFALEGTKDYEILDLSAADNFTLILVKFQNENKFGKANYLFKFSLNINAKIKSIEESSNPIQKEEYKYEEYSTIKQVYATSERIILLTEDNSVFVKGSDFNLEIHNKYKEIIRKYHKSINYLCLGKNYCLFMLNDGSVYGIGLNQYGELGTNTKKYERRMFKLNYFESEKLTIKEIVAGARHTLVLTNDNQLYSFGDNSEGQCTGENECYFEPKKVKLPYGERIKNVYAGYNYSVALTVNGDVYSWGDTTGGKLGYSSYNYKQKVPKMIPFMKDKIISDIYVGSMHTAIVIDWKEDNLKKTHTAPIDNYGSITTDN